MSFGLPWPRISFMHWPTKNPMRPVLPPWYCATLSGLAASTASTTASMAPVSDTCFMPRSSTMAAGSLSSSSTAANTSLACLDEMASSAVRRTSASARAGVSGVSAS